MGVISEQGTTLPVMKLMVLTDISWCLLTFDIVSIQNSSICRRFFKDAVNNTISGKRLKNTLFDPISDKSTL